DYALDGELDRNHGHGQVHQVARSDGVSDEVDFARMGEHRLGYERRSLGDRRAPPSLRDPRRLISMFDLVSRPLLSCDLVSIDERQTGDRNQEVVGVAGLAGAVGACEQVQGRHQQAGWMTRLPSSSSSEYDSPAPENRSA